MSLVAFELRIAARGGWLVGAGLAYAALAAIVTALGLSTFRVLGVGAVSPASLALLELGLLAPSAFALVTGAASLGADREGGLLAVLRAAGVRGREVAIAKAVAAAACGLAVLGAGHAAAALVLAGNVAVADAPSFLRTLGAASLGTVAAAVAGVLVAAVVRTRQEAIIAALGTWFVLAIGADLLLIALGPLVRGGAAFLVTLLVLNPLETARALGLVSLAADSATVGPLGTWLRIEAGGLGAAGLLVAALAAWCAAALAAAARLIERREG